MSYDLTLRPASIEDAPLLRSWDAEPHVIASDPNDDWNWEVERRRSPEWRLSPSCSAAAGDSVRLGREAAAASSNTSTGR